MFFKSFFLGELTCILRGREETIVERMVSWGGGGISIMQ